MTSSSNPEIETKLRRIERVSSIARAISGALIVPVVALTLLAIAALFTGHDITIDYFGRKIPISDLTANGRIIVSVLALASAAVLVKALVHLRGLLGNYSRREIFTTDSARQLRNLGVSCMLWGIVKLGWGFLPLMALAHRQEPVRIEGDTFVIGFVIVMLSWFAEMAAELRAEADLTI